MIPHLDCCGIVVVHLLIYMNCEMQLMVMEKYLITGQCSNPIGSTDGINWAARTVNFACDYYGGVFAVDYHDGIFLAGGISSFNNSGCSTRARTSIYRLYSLGFTNDNQ